MKRQNQPLDFNKAHALMLSIEENASRSGRYTIGVVCKQQIRAITKKASKVVSASLFTLCCALLLAQTTAAQQYQVSYLDDLGGSSRGSSITNRGWVAGFSLLTGNQRDTQRYGETARSSIWGRSADRIRTAAWLGRSRITAALSRESPRLMRPKCWVRIGAAQRFSADRKGSAIHVWVSCGRVG